MVRCLPLRCDWPTERWPTQWMATSPNESSAHTVDGRNPAPVDKYSLSHSLQGLIHPWWCRISSITIFQVARKVKLKFLQKRYLAWLYQKKKSHSNMSFLGLHFLVYGIKHLWGFVDDEATSLARPWEKQRQRFEKTHGRGWFTMNAPPLTGFMKYQGKVLQNDCFLRSKPSVRFAPRIMVMWKTPEQRAGTSRKTLWFGAKKWFAGLLIYNFLNPPCRFQNENIVNQVDSVYLISLCSCNLLAMTYDELSISLRKTENRNQDQSWKKMKLGESNISQCCHEMFIKFRFS